MTRIVSVVNQKGGVAKTTSCANVGACLAQQGFRTLLIDLDPQANLTLGLRQEWDEMPYGLQHTIVDRQKAPLVGLVRHVGDLPLYLVPGHVDMARAEAALVRRDETAYNLRDALGEMLESFPFDWILIDCPPSLGVLTQNAIVASTHLLVPTEPKMYAFAGMDILNKMVSGLSRDYQFEVKLLGVQPAATGAPDADGVIRWRVDLAPGATQTLKLDYQITRPKDWKLYQN